MSTHFENTRLVPQCEMCYIEDNSIWEPESVGDDGSLVSKLVSVSVPLTIKPGVVNICATCGDVTVVGIHVRLPEDEIEFDEEPLGSIENNS